MEIRPDEFCVSLINDIQVNGMAEIEGDGDEWEAGDGIPPETPDPDDLAGAAEPTPRRAGPAAHDEQQLRAWISRVVEQDQAALAALYDSLIGQVYGLALRITRRATLAEEVAQDAFWQIWRQAPRYDAARGSAFAWIMTIARSRALDELRRVDARLCELEPDTLADLDNGADDNPADVLAAFQEGERIHAALARLDPVPRQLLSLAFLRGLSHDEIATREGMPLGTVKTHIRRGLATLRALLANATDCNIVNK